MMNLLVFGPVGGAVMPDAMPPGPPAHLVSGSAGLDMSDLPRELCSLGTCLPPRPPAPAAGTPSAHLRAPGLPLLWAASQGPSEVRSLRITVSFLRNLSVETLFVCVHVGKSAWVPSVQLGEVSQQVQLGPEGRGSPRPARPERSWLRAQGALAVWLSSVDEFSPAGLSTGFPMSREHCLYERSCRCLGAFPGTSGATSRCGLLDCRVFGAWL